MLRPSPPRARWPVRWPRPEPETGGRRGGLPRRMNRTSDGSPPIPLRTPDPRDAPPVRLRTPGHLGQATLETSGHQSRNGCATIPISRTPTHPSRPDPYEGWQDGADGSRWQDGNGRGMLPGFQSGDRRKPELAFQPECGPCIRPRAHEGRWKPDAEGSIARWCISGWATVKRSQPRGDSEREPPTLSFLE